MPEHLNIPMPLFLSEAEALALLNLCMISQADCDPLAESAMTKLANLVRDYIAEEIQTERFLAQSQSAHPIPLGERHSRIAEPNLPEFAPPVFAAILTDVEDSARARWRAEEKACSAHRIPLGIAPVRNPSTPQ